MTRSTKESKTLSKHLLEMKFMKTSRDRIREEEDVKNCKTLFYDQVSDEMKSSSSKFIVQPSWIVCEELKCGRKSFRGMNPVIEKIMDMENWNAKYALKVKEEDVDVTAEEMINIYRQESTLIESTTNKMKRSRRNLSPPCVERKFMKPADD